MQTKFFVEGEETSKFHIVYRWFVGYTRESHWVLHARSLGKCDLTKSLARQRIFMSIDHMIDIDLLQKKSVTNTHNL